MVESELVCSVSLNSNVYYYYTGLALLVLFCPINK